MNLADCIQCGWAQSTLVFVGDVLDTKDRFSSGPSPHLHDSTVGDENEREWCVGLMLLPKWIKKQIRGTLKIWWPEPTRLAKRENCCLRTALCDYAALRRTVSAAHCMMLVRINPRLDQAVLATTVTQTQNRWRSDRGVGVDRLQNVW